MNKYSVFVRIKKDAPRVDGTCLIYLHISVNGTRIKKNLDIYWPADKFDDKGGFCLERKKKDKDANDYNMIIRNAVAKANEIFKFYRISERNLTMPEFLKEFKKELSRNCFLQFFENKLNERHRQGKIEENTFKNHFSTLNRLKQFVIYLNNNKKHTPLTRLQRLSKEDIRDISGTNVSLPFFSIPRGFAEDFDLFLKKEHKNKVTTCWGRHRDVKTYLEAAEQEHMKFENPYEHFTNETGQGTWKPLNKEEVTKLHQYYQQLPEGSTEWFALQQFLFSCATGLRISDFKRVSADWIINGDTLVLMPHKTRKHEKLLTLPLAKISIQLIEDAGIYNKGNQVFKTFQDNTLSRHLKKIAQKLEIETNIHPHIGRETFATLYLENGGKLEVLQQYLGHAKITTTMRYVHISNQRKKEELKNIDKIFE